MPRTQKGQVSILNKDGWIQLRWRYQGKRYYLSPGLIYSNVNVQVAQQRAAQIQLDVISGNFDTTLAKYKSDGDPTRTHSAVSLFKKFIEFKTKTLQPRSLDKYRGLLNWLIEFSGDRSINSNDAEVFLDWLGDNLKPITLKERLSLLNAAWEWGIKQKLVTDNPWSELSVRVQAQQKPQPFTRDEVKAIINAFKASHYYSHYADYIQFKFGTGCRTGEANGLRWRHLNPDCTVVWIGESHTHGQFKDTKTGKAREFKLSASLSQMLRNRRPVDVKPDDLVFPAPKGGPITEGNFSRDGRAWPTILKQCEIENYRSPYKTRHTFISHALEAGMSPAEVSAITGHELETLYKHYAGVIKSAPEAPDLFA
ncbi:tyrosine-type recombinase/integrase [Leptothoe sp. ISB3NOV94-8A]